MKKIKRKLYTQQIFAWIYDKYVGREIRGYPSDRTDF